MFEEGETAMWDTWNKSAEYMESCEVGQIRDREKMGNMREREGEGENAAFAVRKRPGGWWGCDRKREEDAQEKRKEREREREW